jgi:inorganic pyrophosphatase
MARTIEENVDITPGEAQAQFWALADQLVAGYRIVIDRPGVGAHPRLRDVVYPFDYEYLEGTGAIDGGGVDCRVEASSPAIVTGAVVAIDILKGDSKVKWLTGCTNGEMALAAATHCTTWQADMLVE